MRNFRETDIQMALCKYVRLKYPRAIFNSDMSGLNLSKTQSGQAKMMRYAKGFPDFQLLEPRSFIDKEKNTTGWYHGLFIEIKKEGTELCRKKLGATGYSLFKDDHIRDQQYMIELLREKGYQAYFGIGLDQCMKIVDDYMKGG